MPSSRTVDGKVTETFETLTLVKDTLDNIQINLWDLAKSVSIPNESRLVLEQLKEECALIQWINYLCYCITHRF